MTPGSPKPEQDASAATGASEADAVTPVEFKKKPDAGPSGGSRPSEKDEPPDAAELAGTKRRDGEAREDGKAGPAAVSPEDLTTESDDGAG